MLFPLDEDDVRSGNILVFQKNVEEGSLKWRYIVWDQDAETTEDEEEEEEVLKMVSLKAYPHALYQWSTIGLDNNLVSPYRREILISGKTLRLN